MQKHITYNKLLHTFAMFYFVFFAYAQEKHNVRKPVDIPIYLSGTFGELRSNHFHSGMDIKTKGEEGLPVHAVEDGFVYRIKISRGGYGRALYIKHPSGIISVYGHLKVFNDKIEAYIKQKQYEKQKFEIEVFPYKIELPVKKGEIIAYSGNTGGSSGPHLHFEIRDLQEHPLNPMNFGVTIKDTIRPVLRGLFAYTLDSLSQINQAQGRVPIFFHKKNDTLYLTDSINAYGKIGIGISVYDKQNNSYNYNGVYKVSVIVNGTKIYEHVMDELNFFKSHYINTFIDYPYYVKKHRRIQKLFVEPYNLLEIYTQLVNDGIINIKNKRNYNIQILVSDFNKNTILINIPVYGYKAKIIEKEKKKTTPYFVKAGKKTTFDFGKVKIIFGKHTPYYDFYLDYKPTQKGFILNNNIVPLHKSMVIKYDISDIPKSKRKYLYLGKKYRKKSHYLSSKVKGDTLTAYSKYFGKFELAYDSIPPKIFPSNFKPKSKLTNYHFLSVELLEKETGIATYNAYIDDRWILMEYNPKKRKLTYNFSDLKLNGYKHKLKVIVTDKLGNRGVYQTYFFRH